MPVQSPTATVQTGKTPTIMNRLNDPRFWQHYQHLLVMEMDEMLHDPTSSEEEILASLNLIFLVEEIAKELDPPG
jgi:Fe-S-cluster formation regulator IscX/YfhJ